MGTTTCCGDWLCECDTCSLERYTAQAEADEARRYHDDLGEYLLVDRAVCALDGEVSL